MIVVKDRYLYKLGGTTNIRKLEFIDLHAVLAYNQSQQKVNQSSFVSTGPLGATFSSSSAAVV